ncbi:MAG: mechanosensitive ion channel family protein [Spirochaetaceae bacterium]|jgi:small-conductance mechanosensitive channel|nr:mechanosensitive ion channel family protein [Spirochaetaceae bacterium]
MKMRFALILPLIAGMAHTVFAGLGSEQVVDYEEITEDLPFFVRLGIASAIVLVQALLIWGTFSLARFAQQRANEYGVKNIKPVRFKALVLLEPHHIISVVSFLINALKYLLSVLQLVITVPLIFSFFDQTKNFASTLFSYILTPVKNFAISFITYIPNLITIIITLIIARYALRALKFFVMQIERGKLAIPGFYAEWAQPTFNILRVLLIAFTVAIVYPHLPNSESDIFKGVSVLVGVLFSLGSSSVVGNLISGIVMTYMRPFQVGDRIKINDVTGFVIERGPMVIRIRTHKNEIISFPNQMVMNNAITNYTAPTVESLPGLIVHASITMGYDVHWQKVHEILLAAADKTLHTEKNPPPFVHQLKLDDFYCWYEINVYTRKADVLPAIYSNLYLNIQNGFAENGISMYAPHFQVEKRVAEI